MCSHNNYIGDNEDGTTSPDVSNTTSATKENINDMRKGCSRDSSEEGFEADKLNDQEIAGSNNFDKLSDDKSDDDTVSTHHKMVIYTF